MRQRKLIDKEDTIQTSAKIEPSKTNAKIWLILALVVGLGMAPLWKTTEQQVDTKVEYLSYEITSEVQLDCDVVFEIADEKVHVLDAIQFDKAVLVMLNGVNEGVLVKWTGHWKDRTCIEKFVHVAAVALKASNVDMKLNKRLYTTMGIPMGDLDRVVKERKVHLLLDQEVWVWPGVEIGYNWIVDGIHMETLSLEPKVIMVKDIVSDLECDQLIQAGADKLQASPSVAKDNSKFPDYRTSSTAFISEASISKKVANRAQHVARLPKLGYVESLQLVKYNVGQWFKKHTDYFDHFNLEAELRDKQKFELVTTSFDAWVPWIQNKIMTKSVDNNAKIDPKTGDLYPSMDSKFQNALILSFLENSDESLSEEWRQWLLDNASNGAGNVLQTFLEHHPLTFPIFRQYWESIAGAPFVYHPQQKFVEPNRHCTLFLYLNNVEEGGETVFPLAKDHTGSKIVRQGMPECSKGLAVKPVRGSGALFYSKLPNGKNDPNSYHGACPPVQGIKWGSNVFMWNSDAQKGIKLWKF